MILYWPASPPVRLDTPPITISLVEGATGGNQMPSPILGHMGDEGSGALAPTPPAPMAETAVHQREEIKPPAPRIADSPEQPVPVKPEPVKEPVPEQPPAPEVKETPAIPKQPVPEPPKKPEAKPEPKKEPPKQEKPKPEPQKPPVKKPETKKTPPQKAGNRKPAKKPDPIAEALQAARKATSRSQSGDKGNAVEQALAQARREAAGHRGGGGGQGTGPGGGGLGDVYIGQVMLAVRPNWGFATTGRKSLACVVKVQVDMQGNVLDTRVTQSSGNRQFDASAVNSIVRTSEAGDFPPPPNPEYMMLDLVFTLDEMLGR